MSCTKVEVYLCYTDLLNLSALVGHHNKYLSTVLLRIIITFNANGNKKTIQYLDEAISEYNMKCQISKKPRNISELKQMAQSLLKDFSQCDRSKNISEETVILFICKIFSI